MNKAENARIIILDKPFNHDIVITKIGNIRFELVPVTNFIRRVFRRQYIKQVIEFWTSECLYAENKQFDCKIDLFDNELKVIKEIRVVNAIQIGKVQGTFMYQGTFVEEFPWEK